jgi:hypothetical protein
LFNFPLTTMKNTLRTLALLLTLTAVSASAEDTLKVADLTFKTPAPWKVVPTSSPMRAGTVQFTIEGAEKPLEAIFYYFGAGQGGDTEANITRWLGQFEGTPTSKREELTAGSKKIALVIADGTYLDGPPFGGTKTPRPDYTLLGSIVPAGDANVFIKLTGPKADVAKAMEAFKALSTSPF